MEHSPHKDQTILIVDDDPHILEVLETRLSSAKFQVLLATHGQEALDILDAHHVDLIISDVVMPRIGGIDLLDKIRATRPRLPVLLMTAYGSIPKAVSAIKAGAEDYISKPFDGLELLQKIDGILKASPTSEIHGEQFASDEVLYDGATASMEELYERIERVIPSDVTILLLGESGVGKEHIARQIHEGGHRRDKPFIVVDCASTPAGLLESELFGHVRGAFTHAIHDKKGLIETADGGTLFLDEIGNISLEMQVRLLRFLEERKIRRVGDLREISVDCRIISATNSDLHKEVEEGNFREDLYYRLKVVTFQIPPLRERKKDIFDLASKFLEKSCEKQGCPLIRFHPDTLEWLHEYPWPGNIRELKNAIEGAVIFCKDNELNINDLNSAGVPASPNDSIPTNYPLSLEEGERDLILRALERAGGIRKDAAKLLGISRRSLYYKIKKFGIETSSEKYDETNNS